MITCYQMERSNAQMRWTHNNNNPAGKYVNASVGLCLCVCVCVCLDAQTAMYNAYTTDLLMTKLFIWWRGELKCTWVALFFLPRLYASSLLGMLRRETGCLNKDVVNCKTGFFIKMNKEKQLMPTVYKTINYFLPGWLWCSEKAQVSLWMWR